MEQLEMYLDTAFANLCSISVSGPPVVPMGRAIEAVNLALAEVKRLRGEQVKRDEEDQAEHENEVKKVETA